MGEKETSGQKPSEIRTIKPPGEPAAATPEISGAELAELYKGGLTLAKTGEQARLGRFAVAYRLKKAGVDRRNRGTPQKTAEEKGDFARKQLEATFGSSLPQVTADLQAGVVTARELTAQKDVKYSTFRTQLKRAGVEIPKKGGKYKPRVAAADPRPANPANKNGKEAHFWDLVDIDDNSQVANSILERFARLSLDPDRVAAANDQVLKEVLEFTDEEIVYMREQLRKRETGS